MRRQRPVGPRDLPRAVVHHDVVTDGIDVFYPLPFGPLQSRKVSDGARREGCLAELRGNAAAEGRHAAAHATKHHRGPRYARAHRADSRADAGRDRAKVVSSAVAARARLQPEDFKHYAEHDPRARYRGIDQLREPALL